MDGKGGGLMSVEMEWTKSGGGGRDAKDMPVEGGNFGFAEEP